MRELSGWRKDATGDQRIVFRHFPGLLILSLVIQWGVIGFLVKILFTDPTAFTVRALPVIALFVVTAAMMSVLVWMLWITSSKFIITPAHLGAVNRIWRTRTAVPWDDIVRVTRIKRSWWNRIGQMALNQIDTRSGQRMLFGTHLFWYGEFLEVLRQRARNSTTFDPYPRGIGEGRPRPSDF